MCQMKTYRNAPFIHRMLAPIGIGKMFGMSSAIPVSMQNKIADLRKCIDRIARYGSANHVPYIQGFAPTDRFIALWQARNRRTRVIMFRQRRDSLLAQLVAREMSK